MSSDKNPFTQEKADMVIKDLIDDLFINNTPPKNGPYWNEGYFFFFSDWRAKNPNPTKVEVWNFLKKMVDLGTATKQHPFILTCLDFEAIGMEAPEGAYNHADGSIKNAPWRQGPNGFGPWHN